VRLRLNSMCLVWPGEYGLGVRNLQRLSFPHFCAHKELLELVENLSFGGNNYCRVSDDVFRSFFLSHSMLIKFAFTFTFIFIFISLSPRKKPFILGMLRAPATPRRIDLRCFDGIQQIRRERDDTKWRQSMNMYIQIFDRSVVVVVVVAVSLAPEVWACLFLRGQVPSTCPLNTVPTSNALLKRKWRRVILSPKAREKTPNLSRYRGTKVQAHRFVHSERALVTINTKLYCIQY